MKFAVVNSGANYSWVSILLCSCRDEADNDAYPRGLPRMPRCEGRPRRRRLAESKPPGDSQSSSRSGFVEGPRSTTPGQDEGAWVGWQIWIQRRLAMPTPPQTKTPGTASAGSGDYIRDCCLFSKPPSRKSACWSQLPSPWAPAWALGWCVVTGTAHTGNAVWTEWLCVENPLLHLLWKVQYLLPRKHQHNVLIKLESVAHS